MLDLWVRTMAKHGVVALSGTDLQLGDGNDDVGACGVDAVVSHLVEAVHAANHFTQFVDDGFENNDIVALLGHVIGNEGLLSDQRRFVSVFPDAMYRTCPRLAWGVSAVLRLHIPH